jgi:hypothetical protein
MSHWGINGMGTAGTFQNIVPGKENNNSIFTFEIFGRDQKISRD